MTEQEVKELELFTQWWNKHHSTNTHLEIEKESAEQAWFARAKLDKKPYIEPNDWNDQATV